MSHETSHRNYLVHKAGVHSVGQYQMSTIPFITASVGIPVFGQAPVEVSFPRITKFVTIRNIIPTSSANAVVRVGFSSLGTSGSVPSNHNYFTLSNWESYTGEWRVSSVFLICDAVNTGASASIIAGMTSVSTSSVDFNNWSGSLGVG